MIFDNKIDNLLLTFFQLLTRYDYEKRDWLLRFKPKSFPPPPSSRHDAPDSHGCSCPRPHADGSGVTAGADEPAGPPHGEDQLRVAAPAGFHSRSRWFSHVPAVSSGRLAGPADQHAGDEPSPAADAGAAEEAGGAEKGAAKGQRGGEELETPAEEPHALPFPSISIATALQVQIRFSAKVHQVSSIRGIAPQLASHTVSHQ